jgi:hypothetical protein
VIGLVSHGDNGHEEASHPDSCGAFDMQRHGLRVLRHWQWRNVADVPRAIALQFVQPVRLVQPMQFQYADHPIERLRLRRRRWRAGDQRPDDRTQLRVVYALASLEAVLLEFSL